MNDAIVAQMLETLNRIEKKVDDNHVALTRRIDRHIEDEKVYLKSLMDSNSSLEAAFLKSHDGKIDAEGHYHDHDTRRRIGDWVADARNRALLKVVEYGTLSFVLWFCYVAWKAFLKGPDQ